MNLSIKGIAICAAVVVGTLIVLKTTGLESKLDLTSMFGTKKAA
jgi:hypothetical protein